ncbi:glutathione transferase [Bordetella genomosp. 1]|uniref:Glutathione S-transferase n=1 Tax=Bordetella genomosp. 1 TaxID=1395607 RepID=A0ABX4EZM1_9BORD|nr:glutathione transferase [Bordetella genomosp. 1]MDQ8034687.1 glutathione transferase [Bordetella sp.]OZI65207.1 glutathione S-transferase [Bordetella genomosp. 1]
MAPSLTLYVDADFLSPYALSAFVALTEKAQSFEIRLVDLGAGEQRMQPYQHRAPTCRVPALTHDGFHLSESSAITEYLDELYPAPAHTALYPADRQQRARARQLQAWLRSDLGALRAERPTEHVFHAPTGRPLGDEAQAAANKLVRVAGLLLVPGQAQLFGDWSIADTELAVMIKRLAGDEAPDWLREYADAQWQRPAVQAWLEHNRSARA